MNEDTKNETTDAVASQVPRRWSERWDEAIKLLMQATERDDPSWEGLVEDWYDEDTDTMPCVWDVLRTAGFSDDEIEKAAGLESGRLAKLGL